VVERRRDILFVGRLVDYKGVSILIEAFASAINELPGDLRLVVVGKGPMESHLRSAAGSLGVAQRVDFLGYVDRDTLSRLYERALLFVHPGLWPEPFGLTVLEAMSHETPVVVSDVGAPPWIGGSAVRTFKRGDALALGRLLVALVHNQLELATMAKEGVHNLRRFRVSDHVVEMETVFQTIVTRSMSDNPQMSGRATDEGPSQ